jgi:uncharacterized protein YceH (UPF0502 family)
MGIVPTMLTAIEGRVLGCLLEKERTTPEQYPLTLNALVSACNQSTSREPVMRLDDHEVDAALSSLKSQGLLRFVHPAHGRSVTRYRQVADESWTLEPDSAAVVAVLLLRGPQTAAELRTRTERLHEFVSVDAVDSVLRALAAEQRVQLLERQHGQKEARWQQLFADEPEVTWTPAPAVSGEAVRGSVAERISELEARVARLESALADLLPPDDGVQEQPRPTPAADANADSEG